MVVREMFVVLNEALQLVVDVGPTHHFPVLVCWPSSLARAPAAARPAAAAAEKDVSIKR